MIRIGLILLIAMLAGSVPPVLAADDGDVKTRIEKEKAGLKKLKDKIKKQDKAFFMSGAKETSLLKTLRKIDDRLGKNQNELKGLQKKLKSNQSKIDALETRITELETGQEKQNLVLAQRLRVLYKEGNLFGLKVLFSAQSMTGLMRNVKYLETLTAHDANLFKDYQTRLIRLGDQQNDLFKARQKLLDLEADVRGKQQNIEKQRNEKSTFLAKLKKEQTLSNQVRQELVDASKNLNSLIDGLRKNLERGEGLKIAESKGKLKKPVAGKYLNKFGRKRDKHYDSYIVYNGVNIKTAKGSPVRAVFDGKVLYAGTLEGYGNLVILGHGEQYHSLYGHLDAIITAVGKRVRSGQIIGHSGDTGSLVGETLYFEMRHKGKPIEPTRWFAKK